MSSCKDAQTSNSLLVYLPLLCAVLYQWQRGRWTESRSWGGFKDAQTSNSLLVYLPLLCAALYRWQRGRWTESRSWVAVRLLKQESLNWCIFCCFVQHFIGDKEGAEQKQIMSGCKDAQTRNSLLVYLPLLCAALYQWQRGLWTVEQVMSGCRDAQTSNSLLVYLPLLCAALYRWQRGRWTESRSWVAVRMLKQATLYWCIFRCFVQHFIGDKEGAEQRADHEWL